MEKLFISHFKSPSNIALVKYWGKRYFQLPQNPSISMTLKNCFTEMEISAFFAEGEGGKVLEFLFGESDFNNTLFNTNLESRVDFIPRIERFFEHLSKQHNDLSWIKNFNFKIKSKNSFPHSSGIASSASSFSCLSLCLADLTEKITEVKISKEFISRISREGSGSASRSVFSKFSIWGNIEENESMETIISNDEFAVQFDDYDKIFNSLNDCILIAASGEKSVSSSLGHSLMNDNPYAKVRYENAKNNIVKILKAMKVKDFNTFFKVLENEALELHGLMMLSGDGYILLNGNSLKIIEEIRTFREVTQLNLGFTIDAGPNIHLLYFEKDKELVEPFIQDKLKPFCENGTVIFDSCGEGPQNIENLSFEKSSI